MWNGWWDQPNEGEMVAISTNRKLLKDDYHNWGAGEPNGDTMENCGTVNQESGWNDYDCQGEACVACEIPTTPVFVLRGWYSDPSVNIPNFFHAKVI